VGAVAGNIPFWVAIGVAIGPSVGMTIALTINNINKNDN
jgi:hypothetical protein